MSDDLYKLVSTYELLLNLVAVDCPVRIEVFQSVSDNKIYRARIWVQNTYNLYPTFLNTGQKGEDLHRVHSSDQLNSEITTLVAENPDLIIGRRCKSEEEFVNYVRSRVMHYKDMVNKTKK